MRLKAVIETRCKYHGKETNKEKIFQCYREWLKMQIGETVTAVIVDEDIITGESVIAITIDEKEKETGRLY